ncbi:MAG: RuBisCO large subunit C-terminal-like domain-containing protein [Balneolaceae bacterium]|nr:RuBisCO large subunit C-terminal-like domain-containing protein [Balneolaceae bacterium]
MKTFDITYLVTLQHEEEIDQKIEGICLEQSTELPRSVISGEIETKVVGNLSSKEQLGDTSWKISISWPLKNVGNDISQFINILYGNISLQPGIKVIVAEWEKLNGSFFNGPSFGIEGLREMTGVSDHALSCTALKPLGSSVNELADFCYQFALGGIDIIKDDHGLANQEYAPFSDRVKACVNALERAAEKTGKRSLYFPNITALASDSIKRYELAAELGADGVLICPHIAGLETMHQLAGMNIELPILGHPAFSGSLTTVDSKGLSPDFLYGELWRALGADGIIFPNKDGRFSFSKKECQDIVNAARSEKLPFKKSFPVPGGGIKRSTVTDWLESYGTDTIFLIGGSLYEHPEGLKVAAEEFGAMLK